MEKMEIFVNTPVTLELDNRLRMAAARGRVTRAEICRRAFLDYLAQDERKGEKNAVSRKNA